MIISVKLDSLTKKILCGHLLALRAHGKDIRSLNELLARVILKELFDNSGLSFREGRAGLREIESESLDSLAQETYLSLIGCPTEQK